MRERTARFPAAAPPPRRGAPALAAGALPAAGVAILSKFACPACWPAYAGLLGALGLGFLLETRWLLPLTAASLALALFTLAFRARRRRGLAPFALGLAAAAAVLGGRFALGSDAVMYGGLAALVTASIWNAWPPRRAAPETPCACANPAPDAPNPRRDP